MLAQPMARLPRIAIDLFAGAGGLSLGFEQAGFVVAAAVELDPWAASAHRINFPHCHVLETDISKVTSTALLQVVGRERGQVDVVIGGPPCQGFSYAGRRDVADPRNALLSEFVRLVRGLRPKAFVLENVPGLATMDDGRILEKLVSDLSGWYRVTTPVRVLTAADYGVPQNRQRLFLLGLRKDLDRPIRYPIPTHISPGALGYQWDGDGSWHSSTERRPDGLLNCPTVADALSDLPNVDDIAELIDGDTIIYPPVNHLHLYAYQMRTGQMDLSDASTPRPGWDRDTITNCKRTLHDLRIQQEFAALEHGGTHASRRVRLKPWGLAPTIRAGTKPDKGARTALRPIHYNHNRVITVREAARLMSFPDWAFFHDTKWHGFRLVGAAVPPLLARAVAHEVSRALGDP